MPRANMIGTTTPTTYITADDDDVFAASVVVASVFGGAAFETGVPRVPPAEAFVVDAVVTFVAVVVGVDVVVGGVGEGAGVAVVVGAAVVVTSLASVEVLVVVSTGTMVIPSSPGQASLSCTAVHLEVVLLYVHFPPDTHPLQSAGCSSNDEQLKARAGGRRHTANNTALIR